MDTSDPEISFDEFGHCNHCAGALRRLNEEYLPDERGEKKIEALVETIRKQGRGKPYDCSIGISGGVDSSWLTYKSKDWGLRPLVFHVDAGWNSEVAVQNVHALVERLGHELHVDYPYWQEYLKTGRKLKAMLVRVGLLR